MRAVSLSLLAERERESARALPSLAMASQSPFSRNSTAFHVIKKSASASVTSPSLCSSYSSSSSLCNLSMVFCSHSKPSKRLRIAVTSLRTSSSSSKSGAKQGRNKPVGVDSLSSGPKPNAALAGDLDGARSRSQRSWRLSVKSLFGRRALWRRILFASRKVRSIILLNVITIVYGN